MKKNSLIVVENLEMILTNKIIKFNKLKLFDKNILFLFLFSLSVQIILSSLVPISLSADSFQYLRLANNPFMISNWENRTIGYPLFLKLLLIDSKFGLYFVILFQSLAMILTPIILYLTFENKYRLSSFLVSIFFVLMVSFQWMTSQIMTESIFFLSLSIIILLTSKFFKQMTTKNLLLLYIFIFISVLIKPAVQVIFYILPIFTIIYFFLSKNKFNYIIISSVIFSLIFITLYRSTTPKALIYFPIFNLWHEAASKLCKIPNINNKNDEDFYFIPDDNNYFLLKKKFKELKDKDKKQIFYKKCLTYNSGPKSKKYFNIIADIISKDEKTFEILTSKYDVRGSPDGIDESLKDLNSLHIVQSIHEKYIFPLPFMHIWWRTTANYGFDESAKIFRDVLAENFLTNKNLLYSFINEFLYGLNPFKIYLPEFKKEEGLDIFYWRFVPTPHKTLNDQGLPHWYSINPKIYLQNIYTLEKLSGQNVNNIYKNDKHWENIEYYSNTYYQNFENMINNKNVGLFIAHSLWIINYGFIIFIKFTIFLILPIYFLYKSIFFIKNIIQDNHNKNDNKLFFISFMSITIFYLTTIISLVILFQFRQITMHLIFIFPILVMLLNEFIGKNENI